MTTWSVLNESSDEIVYSPRTSAIARTDADTIPPRMFGTITWRIVRVQPAPRLRDASASVAVSMVRRLESIARYANGSTRMMSIRASVSGDAPTAPRCWPIQR